MSEEMKNVEIEEVETEEVKESKIKGLTTKVGNGLKKHGKKVAVIAAGAAIGFIGYALGKKHKSGDSNTVEGDYYEVDTDSSDDEVDPE